MQVTEWPIDARDSAMRAAWSPMPSTTGGNADDTIKMRSGFRAMLDDVGKGTFHASEDCDAGDQQCDGGTNGDRK